MSWGGVDSGPQGVIRVVCGVQREGAGVHATREDARIGLWLLVTLACVSALRTFSKFHRTGGEP
jgi:hypothetical protein